MTTNFRGLEQRLRERLRAQIAAGETTGLRLAKETGFQQAHISNFLNRKRGLSLEALDAVLKAAGMTLERLLEQEELRGRNSGPKARKSATFVSVPVVEERKSTATQVPNSGTHDSVKVASSLVQRLRPEMATPRSHWDRFIAVRVKAPDAEAMSPRLGRNAAVVIDRHYNALKSWQGRRNMYLVRVEKGYVIRYAEMAGGILVLRPQGEGELIAVKEGVKAIVGRVCFILQAV